MAIAHVICTEKFLIGSTNWRERERSQVSDGKVERALRAWLLLSYVLCDAWCVEFIRHLSGVPCPPFYRSRGSRGYKKWDKEEDPEAKEFLQRCRVSFVL